MTIAKLNESERDALVHKHPEWVLDTDRDAITRAFRFDDFVSAFAFMTKVALLAHWRCWRRTTKAIPT